MLEVCREISCQALRGKSKSEHRCEFLIFLKEGLKMLGRKSAERMGKPWKKK